MRAMLRVPEAFSYLIAEVLEHRLPPRARDKFIVVPGIESRNLHAALHITHLSDLLVREATRQRITSEAPPLQDLFVERQVALPNGTKPAVRSRTWRQRLLVRGESAHVPVVAF